MLLSGFCRKEFGEIAFGFLLYFGILGFGGRGLKTKWDTERERKRGAEPAQAWMSKREDPKIYTYHWVHVHFHVKNIDGKMTSLLSSSPPLIFLIDR